MSAEARSGRCLCGTVRYRTDGAWRDLCFCHCESCRRATGAPLVAWGTVDVDALTITAGTLARVASSPGVERGYCAACGTTLTYANAADAGEIDLTLASLDDPSGLAPRVHIHVGERLRWVQLGDGLPQFEGSRGT